MHGKIPFFATEVRNQNPGLYMTSFDVDSLFTNIPLGETIEICLQVSINPDLYMVSFDSLFTNLPFGETIEICIRKLFGRKGKFKGFVKSEFSQLFHFAVKDSLLLLNGRYYIQWDGVPIGSHWVLI